MEPADMECVQIVKKKIELLSNELSHILPKYAKIKIVDESANAKYYIRCTVNVEDRCLESCFHILIEDNWNSCIEDCKSISHNCLQCRCRKIILKDINSDGKYETTRQKINILPITHICKNFLVKGYIHGYPYVK